ncbi:hypothetical protein [Amphibacillus indicireducens]|uniref:Uncharacterized protein n=1 Tax=Amphibacillus indicireducens TaxID=1076330 RepID=A0ABP7V2S0_9BACI
MANNKMNKYLLLGLLINSLLLILKRFIDIPDSVAGFGTGLGLSLLIFGIYAMNHDITKLKNWKRYLLKDFTNSKSQ